MKLRARILSSLNIPEGMGVIVRTAGVGKTKADIKRDLDYLLLAWEDFSRRLKAGRNPAPLYQESDVAIKTMRDLYTTETQAKLWLRFFRDDHQNGLFRANGCTT